MTADDLTPAQRFEVQAYYADRYNRGWEFKRSGQPERRQPKSSARWSVQRDWPVHGAPAATRSCWPQSYIAERSEAWRKARGF